MKKLFVLCLAVLALISCSKDDDDPNYQYIEGSTSSQSYYKSDFYDLLPPGIDASLLDKIPNFSIKVVKLNYNTTDAWGNPVVASGILSYSPLLTGLTGMTFLAQRSMLDQSEKAPSVAGYATETALSFLGGIVISPDYLGYGSSSDAFHPYTHAETMAQSTIDMYLAAKEYLSYKNVNAASTVHLIGYSGGGYAALAFQKYAELNYSNNISISKTFAGGGAYDLVSNLQYFNQMDSECDYPLSLIWQIASVDYAEKLNLDPYKMFTSDVAANYTKFLNMQITASQMESTLTSTKISDLFISTIFDTTDSNTAKLMDALEDNSLINWTPKASIQFIHSRTDATTPYVNVENAVASFNSSGCDVTLTTLENTTHENGLMSFYKAIASEIATKLGYDIDDYL